MEFNRSVLNLYEKIFKGGIEGMEKLDILCSLQVQMNTWGKEE